MYDREYTPARISELKENEIFVFGSNLAGAHGGGAARFAYERFGAVWGEGVGLHGQTYAIPTMQGGVDTIKPYVDAFIRFTQAHWATNIPRDSRGDATSGETSADGPHPARLHRMDPAQHPEGPSGEIIKSGKKIWNI